MTELTTIEPPPAPWVNVSASATPDGALLELVRLADVVSWLMKTQRLHFVPAVQTMHEALAGLAGLTLYVADGSGVARAVGASDVFGLNAPRGRRTISRGIDMPPAPTVQPWPLPDGVTPGVSAALYMVLRQPNEPGALISFLAMPCDQAAHLWGCAGVAAAAGNSDADDKSSDTWDGARLLALRTEYQHQGFF